MRPIIALLGAAVLLHGETLPRRQAGELDLHQIHTGRGSALLMVMPDGTTALVDAGAVPDGPALTMGPRRPDATRSPGAWIAAYGKALGVERLDYVLATHYHDDHIAGIEDVARALPVRKLIDRGEDPAPPRYPVVERYREFAKGLGSGGRETIRVGASDQLKPVLGQVEEFEIRTVAGNGLVWDGAGDGARSMFPANWKRLPADEQPGENHFSIALRIRYGGFRYFTGADLVGVALDGAPAWHDVETPVAKVVGAVDVAVINHHGWLDSTNEFFLRTLAPKVAILPAWHASHPDHGVLRRLRSPRGPRPDLFTTALLEASEAVFGYLREPFRNREGHIVVRVAAGGQEYRVYVLDAADPAAPVKQVFGPYRSQRR